MTKVEPVFPSSATYLDFIRVSASGGSLTGGRPGEVGSLSNIHLPSSDQAGNPQKTGNRRKGKRHGWPAEQASPIAHIFVQVPLPRKKGGAQVDLLVRIVVAVDVSVVTAS